jgi:hypothetical protein
MKGCNVDINKQASDIVEARRKRFNDGEERANIILAALLDDTVTTYGRDRVIQDNPIDVYTLVSILNKAVKLTTSKMARIAANVGHSKPGKSQDLKRQMQAKWAEGNYDSRDRCADQEYESIGYNSFKTARNALLKTPNPSPWPAKKQSSKS